MDQTYALCAIALWTLYRILPAVLRRLKGPHVVAVRQNAALVAVNALLYPSCLLVDLLGFEVPKIGYMLRRPLSLKALMKKAERRTGLTDWDADERGFPTLYEATCEELNATPASPIGRLIAFDYLMRRLMTRLKVVQAAKARKPRPDLVKEPLFVIGLPRTGTTFLHRLLALDPAARYPETHELLDPLPAKDRSLAKRVRYWDKKLQLIKTLVPQIEAIHELGAREAEECLLALSVEVPLLPPTFRHLVRYSVQKGVPDLARAYALYRRQLEFLAEADGDANKRWTLKCPAHVPFLADLATSFPDAKVVWTHRDPKASLPSLGSMFRTFADMCESGPVDLAAIGREQLAFWSLAADRADATLAAKNAPPCAHVKYADLIKDPVAVVTSIYASFGWTVSPAFKAAMVDYLAKNAEKRGKNKRLAKFHRYSLEEYGLDAGEVDARFSRYATAHL